MKQADTEEIAITRVTTVRTETLATLILGNVMIGDVLGKDFPLHFVLVSFKIKSKRSSNSESTSTIVFVLRLSAFFKMENPILSLKCYTLSSSLFYIKFSNII